MCIWRFSKSRLILVSEVRIKSIELSTFRQINFAALERYKWIINKVRSYGMKVMLTLFHHSLPPWAAEYGGWKLEKTVDYFLDFTRFAFVKHKPFSI